MIVLIIVITVLPFSFININASGYIEWAAYAVVAVIYSSVVSVIIGMIFDKDVLL
jgi:hypothetical protein